MRMWALVASALARDVRSIDGRTWLGGIAIGVVLVAGVLKAVDVAAFAEVLSNWKWLGSAGAGALVVLVPAVEIGLGMAWFFGLARRTISVVTVFLLLVFSSAYLFQLITSGAPQCGCLGLLDRYIAARYQEELVFARNGLLILMIMASLWPHRKLVQGVTTRRDALDVQHECSAAPGSRCLNCC